MSAPSSPPPDPLLSPPPLPPTPAPKKRSARWVLWTIGSFFALILLVIATLPSLLSTQPGKQWLLNQINHQLCGSLSIQELKMSWLSGQEVKGVVLKDQEGQEVFTLQSLTTKEPLGGLLVGYWRNHYHLRQTIIIAPQLKLIEDHEGHLNLEEVLPPKSEKEKSHKKKSSFPRITGEISLSQGEVTLLSPKIEPVRVGDVVFELKENPALFFLRGTTKQGSLQGEIYAEGTFEPDISLQMKVNQFPMTLFDQWKDTSLFTTGIGSTLNIEADLRRTGQEMTLTAQIRSSYLNGSVKGISSLGKFSLISGGQIVYTLTPEFFSAFLPESSTNGWQLVEPSQLTLRIDQLTAPLTTKEFKWRDVIFSGNISSSRMQWTGGQNRNFSLYPLQAEIKCYDAFQAAFAGQMSWENQIGNLKGNFTYSPKSDGVFEVNLENVPLMVAGFFIPHSPKLEKIAGASIKFSAKGTFDEENLHAKLNLVSPHLSLDGVLQGDLPDDLNCTLEGTLHYPENIEKILGPYPKVRLDTDIAFSNKSLVFPRLSASLSNPSWKVDVRGNIGEKDEPFSWDLVDIAAVGTVRQLTFQEQEITIRDGSFSAHLDGGHQVLFAQTDLSLNILGSDETYPIQSDIVMRNFIENGSFSLEKAVVKANGKFPTFPMSFFTPLFGHDYLVTLFGSTLSADFSIVYAPQDPHRVSIFLDAQGNDLEAKIAVTLDGTLTIQQDQPAYVHWQLTPARYQLLMRLIQPDHEPEYVLLRPAAVELTIDELRCPTPAPSSPTKFLCQSGFIGELKSEPLTFRSRRFNDEFSLMNLSARIEGTNFSEAIRVSAKSKLLSPLIPQGENSGFTMDGDFFGLWTPEGRFNKETFTFQTDTRLHLVPVQQVTAIFPFPSDTREQIRAILGPLVNAQIQGALTNMQGDLTVEIQSSNFKAILPLHLQDGYITLRRTVEAELTLNEAVNEIFLKDVAPLLISGAWSDKPIKLYIDADGFAFPFHPFVFRNMNIERAIIDFGKLRVKNSGDIQSLMEFLKAKDITDEGIMEAWFTPIFLSLKDGVASYKRFDLLLAGSVHIALWGKIDLNKDKVRMTMGISPTTLQQRFNIFGLSKKDMFQVKMRGSTSNLELDWSSAYARIGILITRTAGGHIGYLVGGLLEQIISALGEEETPPPTTYPYPWESDTNDNANAGMPTETPPENIKSSGMNKILEFLIP